MSKRYLCGLIGVTLALMATAPGVRAEEKPSQQSICITCHLKEQEETVRKPAELFSHDIHARKGLDCSDCHGGNPKATDYDGAKDDTFTGAPDKKDIPKFCGKCHSNSVYMKQFDPTLPTDQEEKYATSVHGKRLLEGDQKVATCVNCHSVHDIHPGNEPKSTVYHTNVPKTCAQCHGDAEYMKSYGIPTNQYSQYVDSVHGIALLKNRDLAAPACNDCHGNHTAAPPEVDKLGYVCGRCHAHNSELFEQSPHKEAFKENEYPFCKTCHGAHEVHRVNNEMIGPTKPAVCVKCHEPDDGTKGLETASFMRENLDNLEGRLKHILEIVEHSESKGIDVEGLKLQLRDVRQVLISSRTEVHSFDMEHFRKEIESGFTTVSDVEKEAQKALDEFQYRQRGFGIASLTLTIFCIFLFLKIREVDSRVTKPSEGPKVKEH